MTCQSELLLTCYHSSQRALPDEIQYTTQGRFFFCRRCNNPLNHGKNDCCERLTLQHEVPRCSLSALTLLSDLHAPPCAKPNCLWSDELERERDKTTSVSRFSKKKGQKCKTCNKWLTDASMDVDASPYSLGTRRKETDNPVLIFWIKKINQHPHGIQTASTNKLASTAYLLLFHDWDSNIIHWTETI